MHIGVVFPQTEIGTDPAAIGGYARAVEAAGYEHLLAYDHVLGADPDRTGGWNRPYDHSTIFHEPFTLFGYLAALTERIELVTGIIILPQRQVALVAKQAAQVQVLSGGRLRLGVAVGWNAVEYDALGENFHNRGRRIEEQIALLRALWARPLVSFEGRYHRVTRAGINPLPPGGTIPIWMGGMADRVVERTGRLADGWFPQYRDPEELPAGIERVHAAAREAGRDPAAIGIECRVAVAGTDVDEAVALAHRWDAGGATHLSVNTMGANFAAGEAHIEALQAFIEAYRVSVAS